MAKKAHPGLIEFTKTVKMGTFPYKVTVIVTNDVNRSIIIRSRLVGEHETDPQIIAMHCEDARGKGISYLFLPFNLRLGKIAHEAYHALRALLRYIGAESEEEELVAYNLDHLVDAANKHLIASVKKRDKNELRQTVLEDSVPRV